MQTSRYQQISAEIHAIRSELSPIYRSALQRSENQSLPLIKYIALGTGSGKTYVAIELLKELAKKSPAKDADYSVGIFITPKRDQIRGIYLDEMGVRHFQYVGLDDFAENDFIEILQKNRNEIFRISEEALSRLADADKDIDPEFAIFLAPFAARIFQYVSDLDFHQEFYQSRPIDDAEGRRSAHHNVQKAKSTLKRAVHKFDYPFRHDARHRLF